MNGRKALQLKKEARIVAKNGKLSTSEAYKRAKAQYLSKKRHTGEPKVVLTKTERHLKKLFDHPKYELIASGGRS